MGQINLKLVGRFVQIDGQKSVHKFDILLKCVYNKRCPVLASIDIPKFFNPESGFFYGSGEVNSAEEDRAARVTAPAKIGAK